MILKGKSKADLARQLGITRQSLCRSTRYNIEYKQIDNDYYFVIDTDETKAYHIKNYNNLYVGEYITRKEYSEKYNISMSALSQRISKYDLWTNEDGSLVADVPLANHKRGRKPNVR